MKKILIILACAVLSASLALAGPATCQSLAGTDVNPGGNTTSIVCVNGPLTFQNFMYSNNGGVPSPSITLTNPQPNAQGDGTDRIGSDYFLGLNPNLTGVATQDLHLIFLVTGGITQISLSDTTGTGGTGISETTCIGNATQTGAALSNFLSGTGCGALAGGSADGNLSVNDVLQQNAVENITPTSVLWVYKDINAPTGGHLSAFNEDFLVPEPATMLLIGGGLVLLGLVNRRKKA